MKKILMTVLLVIMVLSISQAAFADRPIKIMVGGEPLETDVAPVALEGRTLLPVRAVFEAIGATVDYIASEQKVVAVKGEREVSFIIGSKTMTINGEEKEIDVASTVLNNRTLVPLRACAEAFDLKVDWDNASKTAKVRTEVAVISKYVDPLTSEETVFTYDDKGNLVYIDGDCAYFGKISFGNVEKYFEKYEYDANDNLTYYEDANGNIQKITYNEYNEIATLENQNGVITNYTYDDNGNLVMEKSSDDTWAKYTYDANDVLVKEERSDGMTVVYTYDEKGQLIVNEVSYAPSEGSYKTTYEYDENGNIILEHSHSDDWKYTYEYDEFGNLISETSAYADTVMMTYVFEYDENGNLIREAPKGIDDEYTEYAYDEDGFLTSVSDSNGRRMEYITIVK